MNEGQSSQKFSEATVSVASDTVGGISVSLLGVNLGRDRCIFSWWLFISGYEGGAHWEESAHRKCSVCWEEAPLSASSRNTFLRFHRSLNPEQAASVSPVGELKMHSLGPHPRSHEPDLYVPGDSQ